MNAARTASLAKTEAANLEAVGKEVMDTWARQYLDPMPLPKDKNVVDRFECTFVNMGKTLVSDYTLTGC